MKRSKRRESVVSHSICELRYYKVQQVLKYVKPLNARVKWVNMGNYGGGDKHIEALV
jgi:hypothetical protein